ncbi:unnamed protein product [Chrysodeixis includens]|uniref:Uncharacterized protein n=1 Tax=Chrysodeixis includens TaxID=689277 RepID=A0A9P0BPF4_CHRIL|nr:unnamed protein product [Chrysodeixis includens]
MYFALVLLISHCVSGASIKDKTGTDAANNNIEYDDYLRTINIETPELKLVLKNCELSGIGNCTINSTISKKNESYFDQRYWCPNLSIRSDYEVNGLIGNVTANGTGKSLISYYNYDIMIRCQIIKLPFTFLNIKYIMNEFTLTLKPEGVMVNFSQLNSNNYDKEAGEQNLKNLEEAIREPLMRRLVTPYLSQLQLSPILAGIFSDQSWIDFILEKSMHIFL